MKQLVAQIGFLAQVRRMPARLNPHHYADLMPILCQGVAEP